MNSDIKKTPIPIKKPKSDFDNLIEKLSLSVGKSNNSSKISTIPVNKDSKEIEERKETRLERRERLSGPSCEICGARGTSFFMARCGHGTWLCFTCRRDCSVAMERCDKCDARRTSKQLADLEKACF